MATPYSDMQRPVPRRRMGRRAPRYEVANPPGPSVPRRIVNEARPFWPHLVALFVLSVLGSALVLAVPLPLKIAVDSVLGSHPVPGFVDWLLPGSNDGAWLLVSTALLFVLISLLMQLQDVGLIVLSTHTGARLSLSFRSKLFRHIQRLSLSYHDNRGTTDSNYRIQWDALALQHMAVDAAVPLVTSALTVTGMIAVAFVVDWQLALVAITISPILIFLLHRYGIRLRRQWHEAKEMESSAFAVVQEALGALRVVQAFGGEEREKQRFVERSTQSVRAHIRLSLTESALSLAVGMTIAIGTALVLYIGVRRVEAGALTLGELLLVMTYLTQLYQPLKEIARKIGDMQASVAGAERVFALLDQSPDLVDKPDARPLVHADGDVAFVDIGFAYDGERPVLRDVSFRVPAGTSVGIAGSTGAGKTTLISLLTRFYDPTAGRILLDGVDLRDYRLADLRNQFAIVLQEPVLFSSSVGENIAYARPDASREEIVAAAAAANADGFISALPDGYDTQVGERGVRLSGGERQRIALARAFLKDAPMLVLDEPTSSVDVATESAIVDAMERLMAGRTAFMIAHRMTTLERCDVRFEVEGGRLRRVSGRTGAEARSRCSVAPL
jgi:ATP-binding cassette subfamily B protein